MSAALLAEDVDIDYDVITQPPPEKVEAEAITFGDDAGDSHRKPDTQATAALVDTALSRVQRYASLMCAQ